MELVWFHGVHLLCNKSLGISYTHIIKTPAKRTPAPSLYKDSNLGVPTSPLRFYLRGE